MCFVKCQHFQDEIDTYSCTSLARNYILRPLSDIGNNSHGCVIVCGSQYMDVGGLLRKMNCIEYSGYPYHVLGILVPLVEGSTCWRNISVAFFPQPLFSWNLLLYKVFFFMYLYIPHLICPIISAISRILPGG